MATQPFKRRLPWIVAVLTGGLLAYQHVQNALTGLHIAFAEEQTAIFEDMRQMVADSEGVDVECLEYVLWYYPSGTKQAAGSQLDRVVERARRSTVREIIALLRTKTGYDLGDAPRPWIEKLKAQGPP